MTECDPILSAYVCMNHYLRFHFFVFFLFALLKEIDIDTIFSRTNDGKNIMEELKDKKKPGDKTIKRITNLLCDFLKSVYGV